MKIPVVDLHSDLLSFLTHKPGRSVDDPLSRSSFPQLKQGNVKLQTLAIFSVTQASSVQHAQQQVEMFLKLIHQHPAIQLLPAFENASTFASETEPLSQALSRLEGYKKQLGPIFYISLTWNEENRFGGGNDTKVGLKEDGKRLLEWMDGQQIAIDLSHTSDKLAYEIIDFIDKHSLRVPIIASHSNFRIISNYPRNLPEDLAKELIRRKGLIGLNLFAPFIHDTDPSALFRHVEYGLSLDGENTLCFGADFFGDTDFPRLMKKYNRTEAYYPQWADASAYPTLLQQFSDRLRLNDQQLQNIASQNALRFLNQLR